MKKILKISAVILIFIVAIPIIHSCKKDKPTPPVVTTTSPTIISYTTATAGGDATSDGGSPIISKGVCWNTSAEPTISNSKATASGGLGTFTSNLTQLTPKTLYYLRAYATNSEGTSYGNQVSFTTLQVDVPALITTAITAILQTRAVSGGNITDDKGGSVTARGVCWSTATNPTIENSKSSDGSGSGNYVSNLIDLLPSTIYYVRSYATNGAGTSYGNEISFTTLSSTAPGSPTIGVATAGNAQASITFTAPVTNGGSAITGYTATSIPSGFIGTGTTSPITVTGLTNGTAYTFTVTASNAIGKSVPSSVSNSITPSTVPGAPTLGIATAGNAQAIVTFTGPVNNGGSAITGYTVTSNPGNKTGTGTASPISVTGLTNGTAYTFTVTATNANGNSVPSAASNSVTPAIVPGTPTGVTATAGNAQAIIAFTAPVNNGGSVITGYTVTSSPGSITGTGSTSPITVTGLTSGTAYTFTVTATNAIGNSVASSASNSVIPLSVPGAPTIGTATGGNTQATVTFTAPANNGGSAITGYTVSSNPGSITGTATASPITVTGLTNGTSYTFTVTATNSIGNSVASSASNSATPSTVPGAPTIGTATAGNAQATVTFTAPVNNGGSAITSYTVTSSPGNKTGTGTASPITVADLTNGTAYTFTVTTTNANGNSVASSPSNSVTPLSVPGSPTIGTVTAGNTQATITFSAPVSNGGSAIIGYTVTSSPGSKTGTGTASPITIVGLTNGTAYTFTVTATNVIGNSVPSSASNSVTPSTVPGAPTMGTATAGHTQAKITFTAPASNGGSVITGYTMTSTPGDFTGTGTTSPITVTGLTNGTAYTFTVTATNVNGNSVASSPSNSVTPVLSDPDGNIYTTITIGTQVWMKENLKTTKFNDGTAIPNVTDNTAWNWLTTPSYCWYNNNAATYKATYGALYNWYTVNPTSNGGKNVCPTGWHVPNFDEWNILYTLIAPNGGKLKETGTSHWASPNISATNETGFTALPSGERATNGLYGNLSYTTLWWSSTQSSSDRAWVFVLYYDIVNFNKLVAYKMGGAPIRCLRDF